MEATLLGTHDFFAFLLAAIALNTVPGQDTHYILGRSLEQGKSAGIVSMPGIGSGCLVPITAAAFGLYALRALWPVVFTAISLLGALYLIWLGIGIWIRRNAVLTALAFGDAPESNWVIYRQGFHTNLLNPKVALFFLAFLPQFIDPVSGYGPFPFLFLGFTFLCTGTIWCLLVATGASSFSATLRGNPKIQPVFDLVASVLFIGLGIPVLISHG